MNEPIDIETFIKEFKDILVEVLEKVREQAKQNSNPMVQARCNAKWELIDLLMLFLSKKETDMQKLKSDLIRQIISLDDLDPIRKQSEIEEKILEGVAALTQAMDDNKELQRVGVSLPSESVVDKMNGGHFSNKISTMRTDGKIPNDITTKKRGEKYFLVKLPKGQTVRPRKHG